MLNDNESLGTLVGKLLGTLVGKLLGTLVGKLLGALVEAIEFEYKLYILIEV